MSQLERKRDIVMDNLLRERVSFVLWLVLKGTPANSGRMVFIFRLVSKGAVNWC